MNPGEFLKNLQDKPYETRVRYMWGSVGIIAVILLVIWTINIKSSVSNVKVSDLTKIPETKSTSSPQGNENYITIEHAEMTKDVLKLYFNFNNTTADILNIPDSSNITLAADGKSLNPTQITDRQGQPFVSKILSHKQNFGILVFPEVDSDTAELTFDQMVFDTQPGQFFMQKIKLDLKQLEKQTNVRN